MMMMMMIDVLRPHMMGYMDRATANGNEAKLKMKHPSDMTTRFKRG